MLVSLFKQFEVRTNQFSPISTDWLCLQHTQMPRTQDLETFVLMTTTMTTDGQTDCFTPCACTRGNYAAFYSAFIERSMCIPGFQSLSCRVIHHARVTNPLSYILGISGNNTSSACTFTKVTRYMYFSDKIVPEFPELLDEKWLPCPGPVSYCRAIQESQ